MRIGIAIVSMNRPETLRQTALAALRVDPNLVIVDNGSTDAGMLDVLEGHRVYRNKTNVGLSLAVNQGLSIRLCPAGCDILMHLDDDALLHDAPGAMAAIVRAFTDNPQLGLALPNSFHYGESIERGQYAELRWGLGFCWAIRRELYKQIGGYDEQLLHQQECDLSLRVRMAGYHVGAVRDFRATHNDPGGGPRSANSLGREHLGTVQFRDKWTQYFRGNTGPGVPWTYGTMPLYLMQHWPPDQEWLRQYAEINGIHLNPEKPVDALFPPGSRLGIVSEDEGIPRGVRIGLNQYICYSDLRNDYSYWVTGDGYLADRQLAIDNWERLTGERYTGYDWGAQAARRMGL
jgi:GT2 family glycosyltransferase